MLQNHGNTLATAKTNSAWVTAIQSEALLPTIQFRVKIAGRLSGGLRAICDTGAQLNLITHQSATKFSMKRQANRIHPIGADGTKIKTRGAVNIDVYSLNGKHHLTNIRLVIIDQDLPILPRQTFMAFDHNAEFFDNEPLADPTYFETGRVDALFGIEIWAKIAKERHIRETDSLLWQATHFGWTLLGITNTETPAGTNEQSANLVTSPDLETLLKNLWEIENVTNQPKWSKDEEKCEEIFMQTHRLANGRYVTTIPFRNDHSLGNSKNMALRRFYCLETKFRREPELKAKYVQFMREYEEMGHMKRVERIEPSNRSHYFIPHHAVTRKFRVVFDGSAKTSNGKSLNDVQLCGPRLQRELFDIIISFRIGKTAISADICKMFRQIRIAEEHQDFQRIFWRETENSCLNEYRLTVVTYGLASSPFNAIRSLIQCAIDNEAEFPLASAIVRNNFYVDDMLACTDSVEAAHNLKGEVIALLAKGGFELSKWRSNESELMEKSEPLNGKQMDEPTSSSVLGLLWHHGNDEFHFYVKPREQPARLTKRIITSEAARIYDPQGFLTPITIRAKFFIQQLWKCKLGWDQPIDEVDNAPTMKDWMTYYHELPLLNEIRIPRWIGTSPGGLTQIHIFCDASTRAYGAVAYVRTKTIDGNPNNHWRTAILCSRSRVAPVQPMTIPRLELCAAVLASKLATRIKAIEPFNLAEYYFWTDSQIVLHWINKEPCCLKTFVSSRVVVIQEATNQADWRHVNTTNNPADLITRGTSVEMLISRTMWWNGPPMLIEDSVWRPWKYNELSGDEQHAVNGELKGSVIKGKAAVLMVLDAQNGKEIDIIEYNESLERSLRISAYVLRFCGNCTVNINTDWRTRNPHKSLIDNWPSGSNTTPSAAILVNGDDQPRREVNVPLITIPERERALKWWIRHYQQTEFKKEYKAVKMGKEVERQSKLWTLTPFMDSYGILRVRGRLNNLTELTIDQRNPMIIGGSTSLADRLFHQAHRILLHGGAQMCLQYIRQRFWIVRGRLLIRKIIQYCVVCKRHRKEGMQQFMADLPAVRARIANVFENCGVDYAGPMQLKQGRNTTITAYIAVFVCMAYKTIHLEVVHDLTSEAFIAAMERFIAVRGGNIRHMHSDNGRNFVGANRLLKESFDEWNRQEIAEHLSLHGIEWHFITPYAPHHGGLWEAAVKSAKFHLKRIGSKQKFTFVELTTLVAKISAVLNSRPLTALTDDPTDLTALTPGHFLSGGQMMLPLRDSCHGIPENRLKAYQRLQAIQEEFWQRYQREYVYELTERNKWATHGINLQVGDLVFIKDEPTPPSKWLMGRVLKIYTGPDGQVRSVELRTTSSVLKRPIVKLILLPVEATDPEYGIDNPALELMEVAVPPVEEE